MWKKTSSCGCTSSQNEQLASGSYLDAITSESQVIQVEATPVMLYKQWMHTTLTTTPTPQSGVQRSKVWHDSTNTQSSPCLQGAAPFTSSCQHSLPRPSGYACVLVFAPGSKTCPSHDTTLHEMILGSVLRNTLHLLCQLHSVQVTICIT